MCASGPGHDVGDAGSKPLPCFALCPMEVDTMPAVQGMAWKGGAQISKDPLLHKPCQVHCGMRDPHTHLGQRTETNVTPMGQGLSWGRERRVSQEGN